MDTIKELEVVAYRVSAPLETELGHWLDESEHHDLLSEPLIRKSDADARDAMRLERIKELEADNQLWKNMHDFHKAELAGLKAENERLRKSLAEVSARSVHETRAATNSDLDGYLAAGIAATDAELDTLRTQLAEARELLEEVRTLECRGVDMDHIDSWLGGL